MKLTFDQIASAALGVDRVTEDETGIRFHRFTEFQSELYRTTSPQDYFGKSLSSAGVRLEFVTDSDSLLIRLLNQKASSRNFAFTDIYINGKAVDHLGSADTATAEHIGEYQFKKGIKTVQIYFPWSAQTVLKELCLSNGASFVPTKRPHKMLIFGDSITQGYDSKYPSHSYASVLADHLNANALNKGIGGERFFPALLEQPDRFLPDYITVAYGTNDWSHSSSCESLESKARAFCNRLSTLYPSAKIFLLSPVWRADEDAPKPSGAFSAIKERFYKIADDLPNVTAIAGYDLVPHDLTCYSSDGLHPNDLGFAYYAERLTQRIQALL